MARERNRTEQWERACRKAESALFVLEEIQALCVSDEERFGEKVLGSEHLRLIAKVVTVDLHRASMILAQAQAIEQVPEPPIKVSYKSEDLDDDWD